jgi:peptidoglycan/LPS O-acetylase OafA/YrhL
METSVSIKRYDGLNGLRAYAAIGILVMHVFASYNYFLKDTISMPTILALADLIYLFMVISGFSLCCGYYEKVKDGAVSWGEFYKRRFGKVWPLYAILCLLELGLSPNLETLYDVFINCTMVFGLIPFYDTEVIGVGWFLGVVFVFYLVFPFFCSLLEKKWKAWTAFGISLAITGLLEYYYFSPAQAAIPSILKKSTFIYCAPFFLAGGLIYLYRDAIARFVKKFWYLMLAICIATITLCYTVDLALVGNLLVSVALLCYAIGIEWKGALNNPVTQFIGNISMEIYLCHMLALKILTILKLNRLFQSYLISCIASCVLTLALTIGLALAFRFGMTLAKKLAQKIFIKEKTTQE